MLMHDDVRFYLRATAVAFVVVIFLIAGRMLYWNVVRESYYKEYYKRINLLNIRKAIVCSLFLLGIAVGVLSVWELSTNNFNEWLGLKISCYIFIWSFAIFTVIVASADTRTEAKKLRPYRVSSAILGLVGIVVGVVCLIYGCNVHGSHEKVSVEREIISSTELMAANDGQQFDGSVRSSLFATTFTISENGAYRYYYQIENGGIKQGYVDADETTIYYTKEDETPHLDYLTSYTYSVHIKNNEPHKEKTNEKTWYELYVPEGSVVEAYVFDLQ